MNLLTYLLEPWVFLGALLGLALLAFWLVRWFIVQEKKMRDLEQKAALNQEMYHGLKSQYEELEKSSEQLFQELEEKREKESV